MQLLKYLYLSFCIFFLSTIQVKASYIDPSVMTYAIQAIAGIAIAVGTFLNLYLRKIRKRVGLDGLISNRFKEKEVEELIYNNPLTGKRIIAGAAKDNAVRTVGDHKTDSAAQVNKFRAFWDEYKYCFILATAFSFMLFIFSPLELYFNNKLDFWFDFKTILPVLLKFFAAGVFAGCALFALCYLLFDELYHVVYVLCFALFICFYFQGSFFSGNLPSLDGTAIDWTVYSSQMRESLILWTAIPLVVFLILRAIKIKNFYKLSSAISGAILAMLSVSLIVVGIKNDAFKSKQYRVPTTMNLFQMSDKQNVVIFMIDALDARIFSDVLEKNPEYKEDFEDFTFFPNSVGAYPFTSYALPQMLTGVWNENKTDYQTYFTNAMDEAPLFKKLRQDGFDMGMYETSLVYENDNILQFNNIIDAETGITDGERFMTEELNLFLYKYAPYQLKKYAKPNFNYFYRTQVVNMDEEIFTDSNLTFYNNLKESTVTTTDHKCFKFIHIEGAHVPFRYNEKVEEIDESEGSYEQNVLCSITIMNAFLDKLKESGTYENTAVVMLGDHGFNYDNEEYWGRQNPVLMVKGIEEEHEFDVSQAPISYDDLQEAFCRLTDGKQSEECFDAREGDERKRRFMHFIREGEITEYEQTGYASDLETLKPTGREFNRDVDYISEFYIK